MRGKGAHEVGVVVIKDEGPHIGDEHAHVRHLRDGRATGGNGVHDGRGHRPPLVRGQHRHEERKLVQREYARHVKPLHITM